ncbi:MAG TPA: hypothetical protein VMR18_01625 [Candidatus Saccharimonadales bacterium]|jgi:hypothetical protein|nr:hypothetical protein [Candidatus Saccharimonadales bacterium]
MLALEFFSWWYNLGWKSIVKDIKNRFKYIYTAFSLSIVLKTLFAPWRRIVSYPGAGVSNHLRALIDNLISRIIGFILRISLIITAVIVFVATGIVGVVEIVLWPLLPPAVIVLIIRGLA